jgi:hypothetical protein
MTQKRGANDGLHQLQELLRIFLHFQISITGRIKKVRAIPHLRWVRKCERVTVLWRSFHTRSHHESPEKHSGKALAVDRGDLN